MKKLMGALLTLCLSVGVCACGTQDPQGASSQETQISSNVSSEIISSADSSSAQQSSAGEESISSEEVSSEEQSSESVSSEQSSSSNEVISSNTVSSEEVSSEEQSSESVSSEQSSSSSEQSISSEKSSSSSEASSSSTVSSKESISSEQSSSSIKESISSEKSSIQASVSTSVSTSQSSSVSSSSSSSVAVYVTDINLSNYKTSFINGEEFSKGDLVVNASYSNGTTKNITESEYTLDSSSYNKNVAGDYTITVTALGFTKTYKVTVGAPFAKSISVSGVKTSFNYGEPFSKGSLIVTATMSNNTTKNLLENEYSVNSSSYQAFTAGTYTIEVTSGSLSTTYNVTVAEGVISTIALSGQKSEFAFAEDFATTGLVVTATYNGGATKVLSASEYTVDSSAYNFMKANSYTIRVTANGTNVSATYQATVKVADKLKVLMIGNSFADDTIAHSYEVATSLGIDPANILVADLYIGGCTLDTHWGNWTATKDDPKKEKGANYRFGLERKGWPDGGNGNTDFGIEWNEAWTIQRGIEYAQWDFITFQQGSGSSGTASTFSHLQEFMDEVYRHATDTVNNPNANPNVKFVWHQTWAYASDTPAGRLDKFNGSQMNMYNAIIDCVKSEVLTKPEFVAIIPNGTAVQNARTSLIGDNLTRDEFDHLTYNIGRYMTALNMVSILTGRDFSNIEWAPGTEYAGGVSGVYKDICIESVKNAQANPLQITNSVYPEPDISSLYKFDWQPAGGSYWFSSHETNHATLVTSVSNAVNFVSSAKRFTKEELPVGTVIKLAEGYQVRPDAWDADDTTPESSRPGNYSEKWLEITEDFWTGYKYRAFNVSKTDGSSLDGMFEEASKAMEIYVPYETTQGNTYYEADKAVLPTIDNYTRYEWVPTNGYYFANTTPTLNVSDVTNGQKYVVPKLFTKAELPVGTVIIIDAGYRYRPVHTSGFDSSATFGRGDLITCSANSVLVITEEFWGDYVYRSFNVGPTTGTTHQDPYGTAEHFRIYVPNNASANPWSEFDWQPADYSFWNTDSAQYNTLQVGSATSGTASKFVSSTVMFTRDQLPVGSIITIANGWQYRPEGWNANKDRNGANYSGLTRPGNVSTSFIVVTEEWWGDFTYRAFNVSKTDTKNPVLTEAELVTAKSALKIYTPVFEGAGTQTNPYQIKTEQDMWNLSNVSQGRNYGKGVYFKLMNDIDLSSQNWQPICFNGVTEGWPTAWYAFEGTFDGNGKTIKLNINSPTLYGMGLFAGISGTVKNLTIEGSVVAYGYSGALAGKIYTGAYIEGVTNKATVTGGEKNQLGGLVGNAADKTVATFKNCVNNGAVTGNSFVAGILGGGWAGITYINCDNTGNITATNGLAGGIAGETWTSKWPESGLDTNCSNTGTISGTNVNGLIGQIK